MTTVQNSDLTTVDDLKKMYRDSEKDQVAISLFDALIEKAKDENGIITTGDMLIINDYINLNGKYTGASKFSSHEEVLQQLKDENSTVSKDFEDQVAREDFAKMSKDEQASELEKRKKEEEKYLANIPEQYKSDAIKEKEKKKFLDGVSYLVKPLYIDKKA